LPTSLTHIIQSTRGYKPWRPDADIGLYFNPFVLKIKNKI